MINEYRVMILLQTIDEFKYVSEITWPCSLQSELCRHRTAYMSIIALKVLLGKVMATK